MRAYVDPLSFVATVLTDLTAALVAKTPSWRRRWNRGVSIARLPLHLRGNAHHHLPHAGSGAHRFRGIREGDGHHAAGPAVRSTSGHALPRRMKDWPRTIPGWNGYPRIPKRTRASLFDSPLTSMDFSLEVSPLTTTKRDGGTPRKAEKTFMVSRLALPSRGGECTETTILPEAVPSTRLRDEPGLTRTSHTQPSGCSLTGDSTLPPNTASPPRAT